MKTIQPILTITGSDSTGGSGVQADIRTISELGGYAVSAITSITVQNTLGIQAFFDIPAEIVSGQIEAIMNDIQPSIVKVGMIRRVETLEVVIDALTKYRPDYIIYAPAIWSSNGDALMTEDVVSQIKYRCCHSVPWWLPERKKMILFCKTPSCCAWLRVVECRCSCSIMPILMVLPTVFLLPLPCI